MVGRWKQWIQVTSRLNSFPKCRKIRMILLVLVFASNFVFTSVFPITCIWAWARACIASENNQNSLRYFTEIFFYTTNQFSVFFGIFLFVLINTFKLLISCMLLLGYSLWNLSVGKLVGCIPLTWDFYTYLTYLYILSNYSRIFIGSYFWSIAGQTHRWRLKIKHCFCFFMT